MPFTTVCPSLGCKPNHATFDVKIHDCPELLLSNFRPETLISYLKITYLLALGIITSKDIIMTSLKSTKTAKYTGYK